MLRLAWRNLWRQPRRTWLTAGAMIFSNILLVFMISLQFGMYGRMIDNTLRAMSGHLQVQAPGYIDDHRMRQVVPDVRSLAAEIREALDGTPVAARAEAYVLASSDERSYGISVTGVEPGREPDVSTLPGLIVDGRYLDGVDAAEAVIGSVLARNLRIGIGDELTVLGSGRDGSFAATIAEVVGIFESGIAELDRSVTQIPLGFFDETFYMRGAGHAVVVAADGIGEVDRIELEIEAVLGTDSELVVHDWERLQPGLKQAIQADLGSSFFIYGVLAILVAFSVLNTQLMSVLERTREFGIVMALGLKPGRLARLVFYETGLIGLLGLSLGAAAGVAVTAWFTVHGFTYPGLEEMADVFNLPPRMYPELSVVSVLTGPLVLLVFSLLAAVYPALRLLWLTPVDAMRSA